MRKRNNILYIGLFVLIFLAFPLFTKAITVSVCSSGCDYTLIQDAVYNVSNGDIVNLPNSSFVENVTVNASVTLNATEYISLTGGFNILADNVTISGFNITTGIEWNQTGVNGSYRIGVLVNSNDNVILNNYFIDIVGDVGDIPDDYLTGGVGGLGAAIYLNKSPNNNITNNVINNISGALGVTGGYDGTGGAGGMGVGIFLDSSTNNNIINNTISEINERN